MKQAFTLLMFLFFISIVYGKEIHVSPAGNDLGDGTVLNPFKTVERARDEARKFIRKEPVAVFLHGGRYFINKTIEFTSEDSGNEKYPVSYEAYNDELPIISGGERLENWEKDGNLIWKTSSKGELFRQLYINEKKAIRSRYPNNNQYLKLQTWDIENKEILLDPKDVQDWRSFDQVEIFVQMSWSIAIMRLESFMAKSGQGSTTIQIKNPERDIVFKRMWPKKMPNQTYHFENAREFIDQPGEWALDKKSQTVYFYPFSDMDISKAEVIVPKVQTLVSIKGTLDQPVKYLSFKGIKFMHSNWDEPSKSGYLNIQAGQYNIEPTLDNQQYVMRPPAAVLVECAHNIKFEQNVFTKLGAVALDLHYGTKECEVVGNVFYEISGTAISLAKLSDPNVEIHLAYNPNDKRELCLNDRIHNNYIENVGFDYGGAIGILAGWPVGVKIDHNELKNLAYTGISVGWGWTKSPNAMRDNMIRWNKIDNPCSLFGDGGGIYTLSNMPNSLVYRNYIFNVKRSEWATGASTKCYYFDEGSSGISFIENHENCGEGIERLRLHVTGQIICKSPESWDQYKVIISESGLQNEYKNIKQFVR